MTTNKKAGKQQSPMEKLLGAKLLTEVGKEESTAIVLKGKKLVLLYFSASWCPPCKKFTPVLAEFYQSYCVKNEIEIVYISSDKDIPSFDEYFGKMPWLSLPTQTMEIKQELATQLRISGLPTLVVLDAKGNFVTDRAREEVSLAAKNEEKEKSLVSKWKSTEAVPISEAPLSGSGPPGTVMKIIQAVLTNPMYMIGIYMLFKKGMKAFSEMRDEEEL